MDFQGDEHFWDEAKGQGQIFCWKTRVPGLVILGNIPMSPCKFCYPTKLEAKNKLQLQV